MSTYTPYPQPEPPAPPSPEPRRSGATKPIMIIIAVVGAIALVGILVTTLFTSIIGLSSQGSVNQTAHTSGVTQLELNSNAGRVDILFDDVDQATLDATGEYANRWELTRDGDVLAINAPDQWWSWCWFNCDDTHVTVTLPQELNDGSLNAEMDLNAGQLNVSGSFNDLAVELNAGEINVAGAARTLQTEVNAGNANFQLADVEAAAFEISAGRIASELTGTAPTTTDIDASAGQLILELPDAEYAVVSDISAASLDNTLRTAPDAANRITIDLAVGDVTLRPGTPAQQ
ncbi:MAG TPA: DUF4097 domain-containing protein [Enteractinococcus helveticum]|uniref:DUF4097 domain-containing protein n=1 Tax=Enteractinococcus helveticum TaxID=1837282 RepID=A0A921K6H2_9MICC|nr:DUF4097 family beta strand repeat-containing protein [Enteractinococcus helveticum]HJF13417.1 DUF4097 domain-containing protein [Enteractinococcus helveticum]